jgi:hypothetical protein
LPWLYLSWAWKLFPRSQWQSGLQAIVIMEQQRSWLMNPAAVQAGVRSGMRRAGIELLCHDARFQQRDTQREQALLQQCAEVLLQFTPSVCMLAPATVLMDVTASLRLFGGIPACYVSAYGMCWLRWMSAPVPPLHRLPWLPLCWRVMPLPLAKPMRCACQCQGWQRG